MNITMSFRSPGLAVLLGACCVALGACERAPETSPGDSAIPAVVEQSPPADAGGEIDAIEVIDHAQVAGAAADFDVKAFAGTFATDGAQLQLAADGTYTLVVHAESADADLTTAGTWSVEADGTELLLDPDSKDEPDRRYAITSNDALTAVDGGQVLRRDGA